MLYGDYILSILLKTYVFINGHMFQLFDKQRIFYNDFIEFRFFLCLRNISLEFCFFSVIYDENNFLIVNKKIDLSVSGKNCLFLDSLLYIYPRLFCIPKQGIVHRLDKCTTGLLIIAKTKFSFFFLSKLFLFQKVIRVYNTLILGTLMSSGFIRAPLTFYNNINAVFVGLQDNYCKYSVSFYRIIRYFYKSTLVKIYLGSGRKHQIRAHFSSIKHPIIGDFLYKYFDKYQIFCNLDTCYFFLQARQVIFFHSFLLRFFSFSLRVNWVLK